MPPDWNAANAAHLYRRAGFGATPKDLDKSVKQGLDKTLAALGKPDSGKGKLPGSVEGLEQLQAWWLRRMVKPKRPLAEKLALVWHNHFATGLAKVGSLKLMHRHVSTLRGHGLGSFREMLLAVAQDPAMLIWLDNWKNFAGSTNLNFARELMELFTTGVLDKSGAPNYTETDVAEVARAFTGWSLNDDWDGFEFKAWGHDSGSKTVKGVTGNLDGADVIDLLAVDPATAQRVAWKLWSSFAYPVALGDPVVDELAAVYLASDTHIAPVMDHLFRHDLFWSDTARKAVVKSPAEFVATSLRAVGGKVHKGYPWDLGYAVRQLGQSLFDPPSVFGWDEGLSWVSTAGLLERAHRGAWIADARETWEAVSYKPEKLLGKKKDWETLDGPAVVAKVLAALGVEDSQPATVAALAAYVAADPSGAPQAVVVDEGFIDTKVRGLVALVLASPEYQMA